MKRVCAGFATCLVLAGCGGGNDEELTTPVLRALDVAQAIDDEPPEPAPVRGFIVYPRNRAPRLCSALAESFPPQCGEPSLEIEGSEVSELGYVLEGDRGTVWTDEPVVLIGLVRGGKLIIEEPHQ